MAYAQYTLAQVRQLLQYQLGAASTTFWRTAELNGIINDGLRFFNACTGFWKAGQQLGTGSPPVTVIDQTWYTIPTGTITGSMRMTFNGNPLFGCSLYDLDMGRVNWESETTASGSDVPATPQMWAVAALNQVAIWPADHTGGNSILLEGVAVTPILVNDGDFLNIGEQELNMLMDLMQHLAVFKEGGEEFVSSQEMMQTFLSQAAVTNAQIGASWRFRRWQGRDTDEDQIPQRWHWRNGKPERVGAR